MSPRWKQWLTSLANAGVSGAAVGFSTNFVDPADFNFHSGFGKLAAVAAISAGVSIAKWLLQHPLPGADGGTPTTSPTTGIGGQPPAAHA